MYNEGYFVLTCILKLVSLQSDRVTAESLAKDSGCQSCAEYLQYVKEQGIRPDSRIQNSSSSDDDLTSSSSEEDEKEEEEQENEDKKDNQEIVRIKSPNMNNNNSPNMSSVEEEEKTKEDDSTPSAGLTYAQVAASTTSDAEDNSQKQSKSEDESKIKNTPKEETKTEQRVESPDARNETPASEVSTFDADKLQKRIANWDEYIKGEVLFFHLFFQTMLCSLSLIQWRN